MVVNFRFGGGAWGWGGGEWALIKIVVGWVPGVSQSIGLILVIRMWADRPNILNIFPDMCLGVLI